MKKIYNVYRINCNEKSKLVGEKLTALPAFVISKKLEQKIYNNFVKELKETEISNNLEFDDGEVRVEENAPGNHFYVNTKNLDYVKMVEVDSEEDLELKSKLIK